MPARIINGVRQPAKRRRQNPDQSKEALVTKFNDRIDQLVKEGFRASDLPDKILFSDEFTHRQLRQLVSAATPKKSSGVYQSGQSLYSEFRKSYADAMVSIINEQREKRRKIAQKTAAYVEGKKTGLTRGEMGDIRSRQFKPLKTDRTFKSARDESYYIHNLANMFRAQRDTTFVENMILALRKNFQAGQADDVIAAILKMNPSQVLKAYFSEELFDIQTVYEQSQGDEEYIGILMKALRRAGGKPQAATEESRARANDLYQRSVEAEKVTLVSRMYPK